jgi:hypothetical protein
MAIEGRCHCGACTVRLPRTPDNLTQCNCSLCRATGWRGVYFSSTELEIAGSFDSYVRADLDEVFLRTFRCRNCGMATHWEPLTEPPHERMGVNANMLDPSVLEGLPLRHVDGASW